MKERPPVEFFVKGAVALLILLLLTLLMAPSPQVSALRALITVGLAIVGAKILLRHRA
jgi:hypothetical protein